MAPRIHVAVLLAALSFPGAVAAYSGGIAGNAGNQAAACADCHAAGAGVPTVSFTGPSQLATGATGSYTLVISGGPAVKAGMNVAVDVQGATLIADQTTSQLLSGELTHLAP